ncbi:hypothetical protein [uncultured Polaribacter sp.]|uniref:DUF6973 domain-containing protein n=1 Tax=uncultured Polaribacter sp. TaxID=174711 RepID=UPI00259B7A49|nr:hypothetical protein [uncultured Polaribacter sp.]
MKLVDSLKNTKYAIKFSISNQPYNVLYNLVLGKDKNNQEIQAKVIKYTINNMEESFLNGRINFSKIKGEISVFPFDNFLNYFKTSTKIKSRLKEPIPCKSFKSTSSSGGGGGDIQNPNGDDSLEFGGSSISGSTIIVPPFLQQKAQYIDCRMNTWSNGRTGEIILVTWSCADGTSGVIEYEKGKPIYNKGSDIPNCDSIGAVPINEGDKDLLKFLSGDVWNELDPYDDWNKLNECEKDFFKSNSMEIAVNAIRNKNKAQEAAKKRFEYCGNKLHNDIGDAYRHCYFAALNTKSMGYAKANKLGDAHECNTIPEELSEKVMDLKNNSWGYNYSLTHINLSESQFYQDFISAYNNGQIKTLIPCK